MRSWRALASRSARALVAWVGLALAGSARAEVVEPNGVAVPLDSANGETQLSELFTMRGEQLDFIADGSATPDTFSPLCGFQATFVLKQSGSSLGVGWYDADPARTTPPAASEIYPIVPAGSPVGTVVTGADVRSHPSYGGGAIGFALIKDPPHFSEARFNTVCALCATAAPWVLSVSYPSRLSSNAFYVAFEDGNADAFGWSNDGDFNDYVFYFEGLACVGAGESCEVEGALGVCAPGVLECDVGGALACKASIAASDEVCDALDNDCDGRSDEGDELCELGKVCSRGQCVPRCGSLEFQCAVAPFTLCEDGLCIEPECAGKSCDEGQACIAGECRAPCDGVACPRPTQCRLGACVDPCAGVECGQERVCSGGACVLRCDCAACEAGLACDARSGLCVEPGCESASCDQGEVCATGACVDACDGASCPGGTRCELGACVPEGPARTGSPDAGGSVSGGAAGSDEPRSLLDAGGAAGSRASGGAGAGGSGSRPTTRRGASTEAPGCGCRTLGAADARRPFAGPASLAGLFTLALVRVRRRHVAAIN